MARALLVVERIPGRGGPASCLEALMERLAPDNARPRKPALLTRDGLRAIVCDPSETARLQGESICLGTFSGPGGDWARPGGLRPEGCYALLRADAAHVELLADAVATRTLWYVLTPEVFIASTSQRAIVSLLGDFEPSRSAVSWMLSAGVLGPDTGWDSRLRQVMPGERVVLERGRWQLTNEATPIVFEPTHEQDERYHARRLRAALESTLEGFDFDPARWAFMLSGGIDSRGLLSLLSRRDGLRTITWGRTESRLETRNDANIACRVAKALGVENEFFPTDLLCEARDRLIDRFLVAGEGRAASISPFVDGFEIWRSLRERDLCGAIRGDEAFGSRFVRNDYEVRHMSKLTMLTDYFDEGEIEALELSKQALPPDLRRRGSETLAAWCDRLYQQFRLPKFLAALTDAQSAYVEVANPLLSHEVLRCVRTLPDRMRIGKCLWHKLAHIPGTRIPLARRPAVVAIQRFVSDTEMLRTMLGELGETHDDGPLSPGLRRRLCETIAAALATRPDRRARERRRLPFSLFAPNFVRRTAHYLMPLRPTFEPLVFAFRAFVVSRMSKLLKDDSLALSTRSHKRAANL